MAAAEDSTLKSPKNGIFLTEALQSQFQTLSDDANDFYLSSDVPVLQAPPTAMEFHRNWVSKNRPVLIKGVIDHWPALEKWSNLYLRQAMGDADVTVAVTPTGLPWTPTGYADAVHDGRFVMPEERRMTMNDFIDVLESPNEYNGVFYVQKQNSNLTDEFEALNDDVEPHVPWATEAFGSVPDAVNFWMGDGRAVTSMHKDNYENLYCVIRGQKTFTLIPPTDQPFIPYREYDCGVYQEDTTNPGHWDVLPAVDHTQKVPWIPIDPLNPDLQTYPDYAKARPITVRVAAGETLYLPSLWYHHVQQSHGCIAVNLWYNEQFDD